MPTYEYICTACEHEWEAEQSMKDDPLTKCPKCSKRKAKRQISGGTGFLLKGGGWYSDLYSSSPPPAEDADKSDGGASDSGKSDGGKSDSNKSDGGKSDSGKSDGGKSDSAGSDKSSASTGADKKTEAKSTSGSGGTKKGSSSKSSA